MKTVLDREGRDITQDLLDSAQEFGLAPTHLLALLYAESGLFGRSERWGQRTKEAQEALRVLGLL